MLSDTTIYSADSQPQLAERKIRALDINRAVAHYPSSSDQLLENREERKIVCEYYEAIKDDFYTIEGIARSIKTDGLSFIANGSLEEDMPVLIRNKTPRGNGFTDDLTEGRHGQVVSCRKLEGREKSGFHITVRYY